MGYCINGYEYLTIVVSDGVVSRYRSSIQDWKRTRLCRANALFSEVCEFTECIPVWKKFV